MSFADPMVLVVFIGGFGAFILGLAWLRSELDRGQIVLDEFERRDD